MRLNLLSLSMNEIRQYPEISCRILLADSNRFIHFFLTDVSYRAGKRISEMEPVLEPEEGSVYHQSGKQVDEEEEESFCQVLVIESAVPYKEENIDGYYASHKEIGPQNRFG